MHRGADDPELTEDLVGVASARLMAAGVPRRERARALQLLSILATLADGDSRVRRPLVMVASEFDLPIDEVGLWLDDLVAVGAVELDGPTVIVGGREPSRHVGITLHGFLETAAELERRPIRRAPAAVLRPSAALLAVAAVVALALVAPTVMRDRPTAVSNQGEIDQPSSVATTGGERSRDATAPTAEPWGTTAPRTPSETAGAADPDGRVEPKGPDVATTTTTLLPCPIDIPFLEVLGSTTGTDGFLTVDGVVHNPTDEDLAIESFTLRALVGGREVTSPGIERLLHVPANSTVPWQSRLPAFAPAETPVRAVLGDWTWVGPSVACPSP